MASSEQFHKCYIFEYCINARKYMMISKFTKPGINPTILQKLFLRSQEDIFVAPVNFKINYKKIFLTTKKNLYRIDLWCKSTFLLRKKTKTICKAQLGVVCTRFRNNSLQSLFYEGILKNVAQTTQKIFIILNPEANTTDVIFQQLFSEANEKCLAKNTLLPSYKEKGLQD